MKGCLDGVRVVELTTMITGPQAGMMLADMGADVVKVENPEEGDPFRSFRVGLYSPNFCSYNRNKRSVTLDLRSDLGREALAKLLERADILLENFRSGVLDRLDFDEARLTAINPRLIHCSITGFGVDGPYASRPAFDAVGQSLSGMSGLFLPPEKPQITGPSISDNATGYSAVYGILAALYERERTGRVRRVELNMLEATIAFIPDPFAYFNQLDLRPDAYFRARASQSFVFRCSDDQLICIHLSSQTKFWEGFVEAIAMPEMLTDPRFADRPKRIDNYFLIQELAAPTFRKRTRAEWLDHFAKFDVPFAPIYQIEEVQDDAQVQHLQSFVALEHPTEGEVMAIRRPIWFDGSREDQPLRAPPTLGEHTEEVLRELGLGADHARQG